MGVLYDHHGGIEGHEGHVNYDWHWGDDLWGTDNSDFFAVAGGHNTIHGGAGSDEIHVKGHADYVDAGRGDDVVWLHGHHSTVVGDAGNDTVHVTGHADKVETGRGDDVVWTRGDHHTVSGGSGDDQIHVRGDQNSVSGGSGDDQIWVKGDHNKVSGSTGDDEIHSRGSHNTIYGGDGNDTISLHGHHDKIDGGDGFDVVIYDHSKPHSFTYNDATNTYSWGGLGTAKNVEFQQFTDGVQITVHNTTEAAIARMFHFATGNDPTASDYKSAIDMLHGGKGLLDVINETFTDLGHKSAGDHAGNTQFIQDLFHNAGENLSSQELAHLAGHLDAGQMTKAEILGYLAQNWTSHDDHLGIHIDQTFK